MSEAFFSMFVERESDAWMVSGTCVSFCLWGILSYFLLFLRSAGDYFSVSGTIFCFLGAILAEEHCIIFDIGYHLSLADSK